MAPLHIALCVVRQNNNTNTIANKSEQCAQERKTFKTLTHQLLEKYKQDSKEETNYREQYDTALCKVYGNSEKSLFQSTIYSTQRIHNYFSLQEYENSNPYIFKGRILL